MRVQRIIHPVGQGAFYSERFFDDDDNTLATVVYDCGSSTLGAKELKAKISDYFANKPIDILFLSHLHDDHINGVKYLYDCTEIKNIVLPYSSDDNYVMYLYYMLTNGKNATKYLADFIKDPKSLFTKKGKNNEDKRIPNLIYIKEELADESVYHIENIRTDFEASNGSHFKFQKLPKWVYIPINNRYSEHHSKFKKILMEVTGIDDSSKLSDAILNNQLSITDIISKIKRLYKEEKILSEVNSNSLLVYSGPTNIIENKIRLYGCLYTGDSIFLNNNNLLNYLNRALHSYKQNIGLIQVPHHGSKHNFSSKIFSINPDCRQFFISYGIRNIYGHPSISVINSFDYIRHYFRRFPPSLYRSNLYFVNEDSQSCLILNFKHI